MPSDIKNSLSDIPIKIIGNAPKVAPGKFKIKRRTLQIAVLVMLVIIPVSGLFRIDVENGAMVVLGWQIWFSDFFLVSGLWIMIASMLVGLYSLAGTVFCGWACPQNTVSEWANHITRKLLGKRAEVSLNGEAPIVSVAKNKAFNWIVLGLAFLGAAMFFALIPLLYFYPPDVIWSFMTFRHDARLAGSLYWIYSVWVMMILLDISVLRHFWCRFACVYRVWQHSFKTTQTLHVVYDVSRSQECAKCNYCVTTCFIKLDPRKTDIYDSCINCGDCIDACNTLQSKKGNVGLLKFEMGKRSVGRIRKLRDNSITMLSRFGWTAPFAALGLVLFAWGVFSYQPYHLAVGHLDAGQNRSVNDYRIEITSKRYRPTELNISVEGLKPEEYTLSSHTVDLQTVGRKSVVLSIAHDLHRGLYPFVVIVRDNDGWVGRFEDQHFVE